MAKKLQRKFDRKIAAVLAKFGALVAAYAGGIPIEEAVRNAPESARRRGQRSRTGVSTTSAQGRALARSSLLGGPLSVATAAAVEGVTASAVYKAHETYKRNGWAGDPTATNS